MRLTVRGWIVVTLLLVCLMVVVGQATKPRPCFEDETKVNVGAGEYVCVPNDGSDR